VRAAHLEDNAFHDHRLAAMRVQNSTCVFQEEAVISPAEFVKVARVD
jgi:hypothetical protein